MQNWIVVDEGYLNYLRTYEPRIPYLNYGKDKLKPFFGVLFELGELVYVTQVSHAQPRHMGLKSSADFIKIYNLDSCNVETTDLIAIINLNYMFPIPKRLIKSLRYMDIDHSHL